MLSGNWSGAREILCVRLDTLGDVIMMEPAIRTLKRASAELRITLLTSASGAQGARLMRAVDRTIIHDAPWMKATADRTNGLAERQFTRRLQRLGFDGAVIFTCFSQSALPGAMLCYLADIPLRLAHCRENPYQLLTDWVPEVEPQNGIRHEVQRQLDLVSAIADPVVDDSIRLDVPPPAKQSAIRALRRAGVEITRPWLVMHAGATASSRRWPPEYFAVAADQLTAEGGFQVVLTGTSVDRQLVRTIREQMTQPSFSVVQRLGVCEMAALLSLAPLLVSNNTGPVHLAAGVGTPVVDIYALTNPQHTPWRVPARVLSADVPCKYCFRSICPEGHHQCLRAVTPEEVVRASIELVRDMEKSPPRAGVAC